MKAWTKYRFFLPNCFFRHTCNIKYPPPCQLLYSPLDLGRFFSFLILYTVVRTPWTGHQPVGRPLPTHRTTQTQNKGTQTSMPRVGFKSTNPVFERTKTFHALDRAATVTGFQFFGFRKNNCFMEQGRQSCVQPPTWRTRSLSTDGGHVVPPSHWVPFSSPSRTPRAMVEVF
jgi:hypothetical protein